MTSPYGPDAHTLVATWATTHRCPMSVAESEVVREARRAQETDPMHWEYWREVELTLRPNDHPKPED